MNLSRGRKSVLIAIGVAAGLMSFVGCSHNDASNDVSKPEPTFTPTPAQAQAYQQAHATPTPPPPGSPTH